MSSRQSAFQNLYMHCFSLHELEREMFMLMGRSVVIREELASLKRLKLPTDEANIMLAEVNKELQEVGSEVAELKRATARAQHAYDVAVIAHYGLSGLAVFQQQGVSDVSENTESTESTEGDERGEHADMPLLRSGDSSDETGEEPQVDHPVG